MENAEERLEREKKENQYNFRKEFLKSPTSFSMLNNPFMKSINKEQLDFMHS